MHWVLSHLTVKRTLLSLSHCAALLLALIFQHWLLKDSLLSSAPWLHAHTPLSLHAYTNTWHFNQRHVLDLKNPAILLQQSETPCLINFVSVIDSLRHFSKRVNRALKQSEQNIWCISPSWKDEFSYFWSSVSVEVESQFDILSLNFSPWIINYSVRHFKVIEYHTATHTSPLQPTR